MSRMKSGSSHSSVLRPSYSASTSTRDDRVHPGHARKMVARMREQGHDVVYYENIEGGHAAAADNKQAAFMGRVSFCAPFGESPHGPISVSAETDDISALIDYLAAARVADSTDVRRRGRTSYLDEE